MSLGWLIAIVFGVFLWQTRKELRSLRARRRTEQVVGEQGEELRRGLPNSFALAALRLQLERMRESGQLDSREYQALTEGIDACWASEQDGTVAKPGSDLWWSSCERGWNLLTSRGAIPYGPPPWRDRGLSLDLEPVPGPEADGEEGRKADSRPAARGPGCRSGNRGSAIAAPRAPASRSR